MEDPEALAGGAEVPAELEAAVGVDRADRDAGVAVPGRTWLSRIAAIRAAVLRPERTPAKPKLQAPSTIEYCQTVPTPLSLPMYIVSAKSSAPTVFEPICRTRARSRARMSRRAAR